MASATAAWVRRRLAASGEAFSVTARNPSLLRAQLSFGAPWTAEAAFTVALGVVAFLDGGAEAVGLGAFARMAPAALFTPVGTAFADRLPRDRVLSGHPHARRGDRRGRGDTPRRWAVGGRLRPPALLLDLSSPAAVFVTSALLSLAAAFLLLGLPYEVRSPGRTQPLRRIARETVQGFQALARYRDAGLLIGLALARSATQGCLALHVDKVQLAAREEVFHQGEHGDRFYVIEDGEVEVIGNGRLVSTLHSGQGFGEIALLRDTMRTTTVRARTPLRLFTLDRLHFLSAVTDYGSSGREAEALVLDRLGTFNPAH